MVQDLAGEAMAQGGFDPGYWFTLVAILIGIAFIGFIFYTAYTLIFE